MATIRYAMTDDAIAQELGQRLAQLRINANITQDELADAMEVDRGRIGRLEHSGAGKLSTVIAVLRHLNQLELLEQWLPEGQLISPLQQMKQTAIRPPRRARKRVTPKGSTPTKSADEKLEW
ncbi:helix-turn-helix transcriptional regulator [Marinimicrobium sp. ABcell2]|uniref:helix-turn-helix transcriptional regulator n=1 Tax=Marinimicrobium sp. ABcell2 TaxID=3069751 RepID=UPI0027B1704C|nr:helix-turn-helix transcriptional regulator [Marinimicrobium sp. ABcell2]MDQ2077364.1 helix-turn-helix transcriptional regulator [Marinimicrobium sp. ABcell2]